MGMFRFRALLTLDPPAAGRPARQYPSGTHKLMIHVQRVGGVPCDKYLPAVISQEANEPLRQGQRSVVTISTAEDDAPLYLPGGQSFTVWGDCTGHGLISRRVFTNGEPS